MSNFWNLVTIGEMDECWEWRGYRVASGYGQYGRGTRAHRVAYELTFGDPRGYRGCRTCRRRQAKASRGRSTNG